ncbi:MAG: 30S ribosomal protein S6 [Patescibacteria group bacterium]
MSTVNTYELSFLALPHITLEETSAMQSICADAVSAHGGQVASLGEVHFIPLAYEMSKKFGSKNKQYNEAYFTWMKFSLSADKLAELEQAVGNQANILRYIIINTAEDTTLGNNLTMNLGDEDEATLDDEELTLALDDEELPHEKLPDTDDVEVDDLTRIEGIGPVIATTLQNAGITSFADLQDIAQEELEELLAGVRGNHDPSTWREQATLASEEKWDELEKLQANLDGGKEK